MEFHVNQKHDKFHGLVMAKLTNFTVNHRLMYRHIATNKNNLTANKLHFRDKSMCVCTPQCFH